MNVFNALNDLVGPADDGRRDRVLKAMVDSGLTDADLEAVIGALDNAFRQRLDEKRATSDLARCSFCHRTQREVKTLIVATQAAICDECIEIARETAQRPKDGTAKRSWFAWR